MADQKISQLTAATTPLAGTEVLPLVQSGSTKKVATDDLTVKNVRSNATTGILQVAGPGAGTTRTMTVPDANFVAARTDAGQTFTGDQVFTNKVKSAAFSTVDIPAFSTASGVPATVYTFPTINLGMYLVAVQHIEGDATYSGFAVVATDNTSARIAVNGSGAQAILTLSGMNLQVTQNSGGSKTYYATITAILTL